MSVPGPSTARSPRSAWAWSLGLALVLLVSLRWTVHPWYDATNDGSMYLATARALATGQGYTFNEAPFLIRPPGFACLLAPLVAWRATDFYAFNLFVSLWGVLGVLCFQRWASARLGAGLASLAALVLWFNPGYQRLCTEVMSDVPGWALLAALFLAARALEGRAGAGLHLAFGLALGLASLVRSGNLLFLPALACAWVAGEAWGERATRLGWRERGRRALLVGAGAFLVLFPWSLRNRLVAPPPPADQTLLYSYGTGMWHTDMGDPRSPRVPWSEVLGRVPRQGAKLVATLGERLAERNPGPAAPWIAGGLLLALLVALVRRRAAEEFLALGTLLVVLVYFGYAGRLLLPVFALALVAVLELVRDLGARLGSRVGAALAAALALAWLALDWRPREGWAEIEALHTAFARSAAEVERELAPGARLGAFRGWDHGAYLGRDVFSFENAIRREGLEAGLTRVLESYRLDAVLLTPLGLPEPVAQKEREFAAALARRVGGRPVGLLRVK